MGPKICVTIKKWNELHAAGLDIGADGNPVSSEKNISTCLATEALDMRGTPPAGPTHDSARQSIAARGREVRPAGSEDIHFSELLDQGPIGPKTNSDRLRQSVGNQGTGELAQKRPGKLVFNAIAHASIRCSERPWGIKVTIHL